MSQEALADENANVPQTVSNRLPGPGEVHFAALEQLIAIAAHHEAPLDIDRIMHHNALDRAPISLNRVVSIAKDGGFKAAVTKWSWDKLARMGMAYPVIGILKDRTTVIFSGFKEDGTNPHGGELVVYDLAASEEDSPFQFFSFEQLEAVWSGEIVLIKKAGTRAADEVPFGLRWFGAEVLKQKRIFIEIAGIALVMHGIALAVPLYFQNIVDKVLVNETISTLQVLTIGVLVVLVFQSLLTFLRGYLLAFATAKIDMRVASKTFHRLLSLPLQFFERSYAGILTKHMQQTETIREFLTGHFLHTVLDASALFVFVPLLFMYSTKLALIVVLFSCLIALVVAFMIGPFYRRLLALYAAESERQALLVETINGMRTVKSLALEPVRRNVWDYSSAQSVRTHFDVEKLSNVAHAITGNLEKVMTVAVLWVGTHSVFDGTLTVGALVAFQMIAGNVSHPLIQIVTTIHEYQKASLSVKMLGEIMNRKPESLGGGGLRPTLTGKIEFENVVFRYNPGDAPALNNISFTFEPGEIIGIVGRSGSGKSTITRLIQGLYALQSGVIRLDGVDLREIDLAHLRQSIGVVLQENFLFRGTVRENIAITRKSASFDEIVYAATLAGATEFIQYLPQGYDTMLEENASNLSGGQKQRLAIARALLKDPRVLIFDEATSALDVESEHIIQENLSRIAEGRTMLLVAHRLSTLRDAHRIMVVDRGVVVDVAPHEKLLETCTIYRDLWELQTKSSR